MRTRISIVVVMITLINSMVFGQGRSTDFVLDKGDLIEDLLLQYYDEYEFNGSVLISEGGEILYQNTLGLAEFDRGIPLDENTPFYLASLGKQFTATAIMRLKEEGKISLDDPLRRFFPQLPKDYTKVKVRHLMNHTSGLPDYLNTTRALDGISNQEVYKEVLEKGRLYFQPGTKYRYSNTGYVLLAMIIEVATGYNVEDYFTSEFIDPLGLSNTFIYSAQTRETPRAHGYTSKGRSNDYQLFTVGDGGFYSTSQDLFIWLENLNNYKLVSKNSLDEMYAPLILPSGRQKRYGFGWELGNNSSGQLVYHSGELAGFRTYMERQIDNDASIIILTNNSFTQIGELRNVLVKILDGRIKSLPE